MIFSYISIVIFFDNIKAKEYIFNLSEQSSVRLYCSIAIWKPRDFHGEAFWSICDPGTGKIHLASNIYFSHSQNDLFYGSRFRIFI